MKFAKYFSLVSFPLYGKFTYGIFFFDQRPQLLLFSLFILVQLQFKDNYYLRVAFISLGNRQLAMMAEIGKSG